MLCHFSDLQVVQCTSDWLKQISLVARPIRSTTQIWEVTHHQYGISTFIPQTSFCREIIGHDRYSKMAAVFSG